MSEQSVSGTSQDPAANYVKRFENLQSQIDSIMSDAKDECVDLRLDIKQLLKDAKNDGVNIKALKAVVKDRKSRKKLGSADRDAYDMIRHQLGDLADTPLGQAAIGGV